MPVVSFCPDHVGTTVDEYVRDASLAATSGAVVLFGLARAGSLSLLRTPSALGVGVAGALAVEAAFVADTPAGRLWESRTVQVGGTTAFLGGVAALAWVTGPWILAAACWGLATYFCLLALVLADVWDGDGTA